MLWRQRHQWHHIDNVFAWTRFFSPFSLICLLLFPYYGQTGQETNPMIAGHHRVPWQVVMEGVLWDHFKSNFNYVMVFCLSFIILLWMNNFVKFAGAKKYCNSMQHTAPTLLIWIDNLYTVLKVFSACLHFMNFKNAILSPLFCN